jgi:hypothetical protein
MSKLRSLVVQQSNLIWFDGNDIIHSNWPSIKLVDAPIAWLPNNEDWIEKPLGKGRVLFSALPLELNDNLQALATAYRNALN